MKLVSIAARNTVSPLLMVAALTVGFSLQVWAGCATCGSIKGIIVDDRNGTTSVSPVLAGVDVGPGIPLNVDASHPVIEGSIRYYNLPSPATPYIKWGLSTITFSGSTVLFDGVPRAGWSWNSTSQTLMAPGRHLYVFNSNGNLANSSGADGLQVTPHTYSASLPDRVTGVSDGFGTHGHTALKLGPQVRPMP